MCFGSGCRWQGLGSIWTWTALDADTKLIATWVVGGPRCGHGLRVHAGRGLTSPLSRTAHDRRPQALSVGRRRFLRRGHRLRHVDEDLRRGSEPGEAVQPCGVPRLQSGCRHRPARPETHLYVLRGAPESDDADVDPALHAP